MAALRKCQLPLRGLRVASRPAAVFVYQSPGDDLYSQTDKVFDILTSVKALDGSTVAIVDWLNGRENWSFLSSSILSTVTYQCVLRLLVSYYATSFSEAFRIDAVTGEAHSDTALCNAIVRVFAEARRKAAKESRSSASPFQIIIDTLKGSLWPSSKPASPYSREALASLMLLNAAADVSDVSVRGFASARIPIDSSSSLANLTGALGSLLAAGTGAPRIHHPEPEDEDEFLTVEVRAHVDRALGLCWRFQAGMQGLLPVDNLFTDEENRSDLAVLIDRLQEAGAWSVMDLPEAWFVFREGRAKDEIGASARRAR